MDGNARKLFITRCLQFLELKTIEGAAGFEPDNRVKALVAASAVQLTLGLETWSLAYFESITLYASDFRDSPGGPVFAGDTNLGGYVRLSWKSFLRGYSIKNDNLNLGLHEFSHALRFNPVKGHRQDYFVEHYFDSWLASALDAFEDIRAGRKTIFRKYGGTNINEFISVCIEHFFESPNDNRQNYPLLFYATVALLNQLPGPVNTQLNARDYALHEKNRIMAGMTLTEFRTPVSLPLLVMLVPLAFTISLSGFFSGISFVLEALYLLLYLRYDFRYTNMVIEGHAFTVKKGLLVFRRSYPQLPLSMLVSCRFPEAEEEGMNYEAVYYDGMYFYEEIFVVRRVNPETLLKELKDNRIAVYRK